MRVSSYIVHRVNPIFASWGDLCACKSADYIFSPKNLIFMSNKNFMREYLAPEFEVVNFNCEAGFAVSLDNLTEEQLPWEETTF